MPKTNQGAVIRETRRVAASKALPSRNVPAPAKRLLSQTMHTQLYDVAAMLQDETTRCLVCPPDRDGLNWPAGPAGPDGFLQTVADAPDNPQVLSWPTSPERYIQACLNAVQQDIRKLNEKQIRLGPEPARRYRYNDRNLYQWGICARCRRELSAHFAGADRDCRNAAVLRWGLAAYMGRVCATSRWRQYYLESYEMSAQDARREQEIPLVMAQTDQWRQTGYTAQGLVIKEIALELPLRIAVSVPSWQERASAGAPPKLVMADLWPEPAGTNRLRYPHRLVVGCVADLQDEGNQAENALSKTIRGVTTLIARDIKMWLPELGGNWEFLYLSPADYASKKRVPPRVKKLLEAACGQRLNDA